MLSSPTAGARCPDRNSTGERPVPACRDPGGDGPFLASGRVAGLRIPRKRRASSVGGDSARLPWANRRGKSREGGVSLALGDPLLLKEASRAHVFVPLYRMRKRVRRPSVVQRRSADRVREMRRRPAQAVQLRGHRLQGLRLLPQRCEVVLAGPSLLRALGRRGRRGFRRIVVRGSGLRRRRSETVHELTRRVEPGGERFRAGSGFRIGSQGCALPRARRTLSASPSGRPFPNAFPHPSTVPYPRRSHSAAVSRLLPRSVRPASAKVPRLPQPEGTHETSGPATVPSTGRRRCVRGSAAVMSAAAVHRPGSEHRRATRGPSRAGRPRPPH